MEDLRFYKPSPEDRLRILPARKIHTHLLYDKVSHGPIYYQHPDTNCPICKLSALWQLQQLPWYRRLFKLAWWKNLIRRFK